MRYFFPIYIGVCALMLFLLLTGCGGSPAAQGHVQSVSVPVTVPCVSGQRPDPVPPLRSTIAADAWATLTPRQKAAQVAAQALRQQSRADGLEAATGACQ